MPTMRAEARERRDAMARVENCILLVGSWCWRVVWFGWRVDYKLRWYNCGSDSKLRFRGRCVCC